MYLNLGVNYRIHDLELIFEWNLLATKTFIFCKKKPMTSATKISR